MHFFGKTRTPGEKLQLFGYLCGALGALVLMTTAAVLALYEFTGASSFLDVEIVGDLRDILRVYAFALVPALGIAFLTVPFAIRGFFRESSAQG